MEEALIEKEQANANNKQYVETKKCMNARNKDVIIH